MADTLEEFLEGKYGEVKRSGDNILVNCGFCEKNGKSEDTGFNLWISATKHGAARCWRCGWKGRVWDDSINTSTREALAVPRSRLNVFDAKDIPKCPLPEGYLPIFPGCSPMLKRFCTYLVGRGVSLKQAKRYHIGACITGLYRGMLILPVTYGGKVVYWQARRVYGEGSKNMNPPNDGGMFGKSAFLMGWDHVNPNLPVPLVEGPFDQYTTPNSLSGLGKEYSETQIFMLVQLNAVEYVVCLDSDARPYTAKLAYALKGYGVKVRMAGLPDGDPNDLRKEIDGWIDLAQSATLANIIRQKLGRRE